MVYCVWQREKPQLTQNAVEKIAEEYKEIRAVGEVGRTLPVTVRTLEARSQNLLSNLTLVHNPLRAFMVIEL